jgi:hypothetical protein
MEDTLEKMVRELRSADTDNRALAVVIRYYDTIMFNRDKFQKMFQESEDPKKKELATRMWMLYDKDLSAMVPLLQNLHAILVDGTK